MAIFTGSATAMVTPFKEDGNINFDAFEKLIEFQLENETDALVICGTTGEASTLTDDEQIEAIRFAVSKTDKRVPVIAGTGSNDTNHGIHLSKKAQEVGADALLVVTPYYNKTTQAGLVYHYDAIAAAVDLPIILYNIAGRTGLNITPRTMLQLSKIPNIVGVKEASGNITQVAEIAYFCGSDFEIYSGNDDQVVPLMALGAKGVISAAANVIPKKMHDMVKKFLDGNIEGSREIQLDILPLVNALFVEVNPIPVKHALNFMGLDAGGFRMPLTEMGEKNLQGLEKILQEFGLI